MSKLLTATCLFLLPIFLFSQPSDGQTLEAFLSEKNLQPERTDQGLFYQIHQKGGARQPKKGDYVLVKYTGKRLSGDQFDAADKYGFAFQVGYRQVIRALDQGVQLLGEGGTATFYVPPHLGYGDVGIEEVLPPGAALVYEFKLEKILSPAEYDRHMLAEEQRAQAEYEKEVQDQFEKDLKIIRAYAKDHNLKPLKTTSGLHYLVTKKGKGANAKIGSSVKIHYDGFFADGKEFDSTKKRGAPFTFAIGEDKLIEGWEEGLQFFNTGSEGWLLIPSKLAYGPEPVEAENLFIPGNSVLVFKVKVLEVK
jgi:FKBP-type peptidyl-prolyl cis-trans isomerase